MKRFSKIITVLAGLTLFMVFVGCSNNAEEVLTSPAGGTYVMEGISQTDQQPYKFFWIFDNDNTVVMTMITSSSSSASSGIWSINGNQLSCVFGTSSTVTWHFSTSDNWKTIVSGEGVYTRR
ncbi:MAG: hypothetical protein J6X54_05095 [Treponema sp.]|nr:hypothetical protein [Treponema sp.]